MKYFPVIASVLLVTFGCKPKPAEQNDRKDSPTNPAPAANEVQTPPQSLPPQVEPSDTDTAKPFAVDSTVAADAITAQMEEAVSASISADPVLLGTEGALGLAENSYTYTPKCTEDAATKSATESMVRSLKIDRSCNFFGRLTTIKVDGQEDVSRKFSKDSGEVKCLGLVVLRPENLKGVVMDTTFSRSHSRMLASNLAPGQAPGPGSILETLLGTLFPDSSTWASKGTRKISWTADDTFGGLRSEKHSIETDVTRKGTRKRKDVDISYESAIKTKVGEPLMVSASNSTHRGIPTFVAVPHQKTIESGTLIVTRRDGSRIDSHFENVKYDFLKPGCVPSSGKLTGEIFAPVKDPAQTPAAPAAGLDDPAPTATSTVSEVKKFSINFAVQPPVIEFSDGKKEPFLPMGCEFENLSQGVK